MAGATTGATADAANVALFADLARDWWDPDGRSRLLHRINPLRLAFIRDAACRHFGRDPRQRRPLAGLAALDVGCGAGLVAEPLARMGARVTGIDEGAAQIEAARDHAAAMGLAIDYRSGGLDAPGADDGERFDLVTCLEVVEHVTDVPAFLAGIARRLRPEGLLVFSTPNRTALSWAVMIAGAERLLKLIPDGGHDWAKFLTPDELTHALATAGLRVTGLSGIGWSPLGGFALGDDLSVNYIGTAVPASGRSP